MPQSRQPFGDFLNNTPSSRGARGRGRGGGGGFGRGRGGSRQDYSAVPPNYDLINRQKMAKLEGFAPSPYTPPPASGATTPTNSHPQSYKSSPTPNRGRGSPRGFGRGSGALRGGLGAAFGSFGRGGGSTGLGDLRGAPKFIKAGQLFKDGQLHDDLVLPDVLTAADKRSLEPSPLAAAHERVEHLQPTSPPRTSTSVDNSMNVGLQALLLDDKPERYSPSAPAVELPPLQAVMDEVGSDLDEDAMMALIEEHSLIKNQVELSSPSPEIIAQDSSLFFIDTTPVPPIETTDQDSSLFFIDTTATLPTETPLYDTSVTSIIGQADATPSSGSEDEKIVFVPKTYRAPEPISVPSSTRPTAPMINHGSESIMTLPSDPPSGRKANRKEKKAAKKAMKKTRGVQKEPRQGDSDLEWGDDGPPSLPGRRTWGGNDEMAILQDYIDGTAGHGVDDDAESLDEDAMRAFVGGIKDMGSRNQTTINDVEDGEKMRLEDEDEWQSTSGSGSGSGSESDEELHLGIGIALPDDSWIEQDSDSDSDDDDDDEIEIDIDLDEDSDEDDGPEMFVGKSTWADESEDFIAGMEAFLDHNSHILNGRDRKQRNKMFKAVQNGDFGDDWDLGPPKKGKKNAHVPAELQSQWDKDRAKKADKKRQRAIERLEASLDPFPSARKGKGKAKMSAREQAALASAIPRSAREVADMFDITEATDDEFAVPNFARRKGRKGDTRVVTKTVHEVHVDIQVFLGDLGKSTMVLPPMDKIGRQKVHMLAEAYGIKSKSKGAGKARFPILIKTTRSGMNINERKVSRILGNASGSGADFYKAMYSGGGGKKKSGGGGGGGGSAVRHRDGDAVGEGAAAIGMENIGHKLLSRMGWTEGDRIGMSEGGLAAPIVAIVKNTKTGLGA